MPALLGVPHALSRAAEIKNETVTHLYHCSFEGAPSAPSAFRRSARA